MTERKNSAQKEHVIKEKREGRALAGFFVFAIGGLPVLFFTTLVALESFSEHAVGIICFYLLGLALSVIGLYLLLCIPVIVIDHGKKQVITRKSCVLFNLSKTYSFRTIREVGVSEAYHAGSRGTNAGTFYKVEIRGPQQITVPLTETTDEHKVIAAAENLSEILGVKFNTDYRKIFTGSYKLR